VFIKRIALYLQCKYSAIALQLQCNCTVIATVQLQRNCTVGPSQSYP